MNGQTLHLINVSILFYFSIVNFCYMLIFITSVPDILKRFKELFFGEIFPVSKSTDMIPVTIIIPAYNEEDNIINAVQSALNSTYKNLKVMVSNDGSTDKTLQVLHKKYKLEPCDFTFPEYIKTAKIKQVYVSKTHPHLSVIDKEHAGRGDTLNTCINVMRTPLFMTLDADSMLEPDTIPRLAYCMLSEPHTIAVGGGVYLLNDCEISQGRVTVPKLPNSYIGRLQACEYMRSFVFGRTGWNLLKGALCYSGTSTLLERDAVLEIGGFDTQNPAQDMEVIVHLHEYMRRKNHPYNTIFTPAAFSWTTVPDNFKSYYRQRVQWQLGITHSMLKHIKMFFNPRYGIIGFFTYPFYLLVEAFAHIMEVLTYLIIIVSLIFGFFDAKSVIVFFLLTAGFISFLTVATMLINIMTFNKYRKISDIFKIFFYSVIEIFGFRQFSLVVRTIGTIKYFFVGFRKKLIRG